MSDLKSLKLLSFDDQKGNDNHSFEDYLSSHRFDQLKPPPEESPLLFHNDTVIGHRGANIITVTGKAKSRKTVITSAIASGLISDGFLGFNSRIMPNENIIHIDTEQGYFHYYHSVDRIFKQANVTMPANFQSIYTRDAEHEFRKDLLQYLFDTVKPTVMIIDGITDLVYDINDQREAKEIGDFLLINSAKHDTLIICVIHTTKTTGFMTGAIGTYLEKKCETSIKVELDEEDRMVSHVRCMESRNKPFTDFSIEMNQATGFYQIVNEDFVARKGTENIPFMMPHMKTIIERAFEGRKGQKVRHDLLTNMVANLATNNEKALTKECAAKWLSESIKCGILLYTPEGYMHPDSTNMPF